MSLTPSTETKKKDHPWLMRAITLLGTAGLVFLVKKIGWDRILHSFQMIGIWGFFLMTLTGLGEAFFDSKAFQYAVLKRVGMFKTLYWNQLGAFVNLISPAEAGEILKASLFEKEVPGIGVPGALTWNVAFKLSKSIMIFAAIAGGWLLLPASRPEILPFIIASAAGFVLYFLLLYSIRLGILSKILARIPGALFSWIQAKVLCIEGQVHSFYVEHPQCYRRIIFYQMLGRFFDFLMLWICIDRLNPLFTVREALLLYGGTELISYVLPLIPTRVGTTEGSAYLLFSYFRFAGETGAVMQLAFRIKQLIVFLLVLGTGSFRKAFRNETR